ncbi:MAG: hypothetical protein JXA99_08895 [Candidatus Lokiarchaeota archaeon]|nr:hypothetical protein [Candidatus Lokiarchaeota archaeon]
MIDDNEFEGIILIEDLFDSREKTVILKLLALKGELTLSEIILLSKLNHQIIKKHLNYLVKIKIIVKKEFSKIRIYQFNYFNFKARAIHKLI